MLLYLAFPFFLWVLRMFHCQYLIFFTVYVSSCWSLFSFDLFIFACMSKTLFAKRCYVKKSCNSHVYCEVIFLSVGLCSRLRERTHSLWAFLMSEKQNYLNPFYSPAYAEANPVLAPSTQPYNFKSVQPSSHTSCQRLVTCISVAVFRECVFFSIPVCQQGSGGTCTTSLIAPCTHVSPSSKLFLLSERTTARLKARCKH